MHFEPFYLACLAHASYLIGSAGEAAVVDPQRDVDGYIDRARELGLTIRYVLETHLHADFVSGHRELAERTGAQIVVGARAGAEFPHLAVAEGDELRVGDVVLRALETPGHTPEGISWLVVENGRTTKVLTGDTLFVGEVGRPDLAGGAGYTPADMASMLYDSLQDKLLRLDDDVEVWPAHGAGSSCGRNIGKERCSTIGAQRRTNYALRPMPREEFIQLVAGDLPRAPAYFPMDAQMNRRGARPLASLEVRPLSRAEAEPLFAAGAVALDVCASHFPGAIEIGLGGEFASWCGTLLDPAVPIVVIARSKQAAEEATMRLARVGFENVAGHLEAAGEETPASTLSVDDLAAAPRPTLDVRRPAEFESGHVPGARNIPLSDLPAQLDALDRAAPLAVICAGGYRSAIAQSLLRRAGFRDVANVLGGTGAWIAAGHPVARATR